MAINDSTDVDITESFFKDCNVMNPGDLYHIKNFDLQDVMTAIELMDPKMDARMQIKRKVLCLKETLDKGLLPLDENITPKLLLGIMDETLACLVNWLKGDTLGQTVFINMYMHCTDQIQNKTLRGFCEAMKNVIIFIKDIICKGSVAEEEDFYTPTSRMPLDDIIADNKVTGMLKDADEEHGRFLKTMTVPSDNNHELIVSLQHRIRFMRSLLLWIVVIKKFLQNPSSKAVRETTYSESNKYLLILSGLIEKMKETEALGEQAGKGKNDPSQHAYGLIGFEPYLNQPLLPPAIPRCANIEDRSFAFHHLQDTITRLAHVTQILNSNVSENVISEWNFLQYFGRFGCEGVSHSCVLSRSLLLIFYMSFFSTAAASSPQEAVSATTISIATTDSPKIESLKSSLRHFLRLVSWADLEAAMKFDDKLTLFIGACAENLFQIPVTHSLNRSRQRNRLELVIDAHWDLYDECVKVDHILRSYVASRGASTTSRRGQDIPPLFSSFVALFQFRNIVDYIMSGFELCLYGDQELMSVYYILGENVLRYFLSHCRDIETKQLREQAKLPKLLSNKKTRRTVDREISNNLRLLRETVLELTVLHELAVGFFYLMSALTRDGKLLDSAAACGRYTCPERCYEQRFAPIVGRGWFAEGGSYKQFANQLATLWSKRTVGEVYELAATYFDSSRRVSEQCVTTGGSAGLMFSMQQLDRQRLKTIAKNNMVVARILASGGSTKTVTLDFEQSRERAFPLIKIK